MDFSWTEEEQMILEAAAGFAERELLARHREHESAKAVSDETREAFAETGLADLATLAADDMDVSWPARVETLMVLAGGDAGAALDLWRGWVAPLAAELGAEGASPAFLHLVEALDDTVWPLPCLPVGAGEQVLLLDSHGAWGVARVAATSMRSLGLAAAGQARCALTEWIARGAAEPGVTERARGLARLWGAAALVGIARASKDYAGRYLQERVAFGKTLSNHQGLAFMFSEMVAAVEGAGLLTLKAAWDAEAGRWETAADAFLEAAEVALEVTDRGVQLLGGHGYMQDHPVEKWMRDARALSLLWGGVDLALEEVSR